MKRFTLQMVLGIAATVMVGIGVHLWLVRSTLPEKPHGQASFLSYSYSDRVDRLDSALVEGVTAPQVLAERARLPLADVTLPAETPALTVRGARGSEVTLLRTADQTAYMRVQPSDAAPVLLGPVERRTVAFISTRLAMGLAIALLCAIALALVVGLPLARGLQRLRDAAVGISAGDLGARAVVPRGPTRDVAAAFNAMGDRVQRLLEGQRHLLEAVSHELRTPAARIRFALEMLEGAPDAAARAERIAAIDGDLAELDGLVAELLTYTRATADSAPPTREGLDAATELEALVDGVSERYAALDIAVEPLDAERAAITVSAERRLFRRALRNLLLNACRHATGRVVVRYGDAADGIVVSVSDDGPGIDEGDADRIFAPFERTDDSRSRDSGGVGLGLAIVRRVLELHGGSVTVTGDAVLGGARFDTRWPRG